MTCEGIQAVKKASQKREQILHEVENMNAVAATGEWNHALISNLNERMCQTHDQLNFYLTQMFSIVVV